VGEIALFSVTDSLTKQALVPRMCFSGGALSPPHCFKVWQISIVHSPALHFKTSQLQMQVFFKPFFVISFSS
jgi:hypothetical protein